jgi:hypothetical protein
MAEITSRPYQPDPETCCEACVFGRGEHAEWCRFNEQQIRGAYLMEEAAKFLKRYRTRHAQGKQS